MELGRSRAEVELTKKLAATLVQKEVMEPMNAIGWRHGNPPTPEQIEAAKAAQTTTPPASGQPAKPEGAPASQAMPATPKQDGQPAPAAAAPTSQPAKTDPPADASAVQNVLSVFESLRDASGLIMGKYRTVEDALKGAGHLANMAKTALQRAEQAEARLTAAPVSAAPPAAVPAAAPTPRASAPPSRVDAERAQERLDAVLSKVIQNDNVWTSDLAREYSTANRELANAEARVVAEENQQREQQTRDAENSKWTAVNEYMRTKYPDSQNFDEEVGLHVRSNPLLAKAVSALARAGDEVGAAELAWTEFDKSRGGSGHPTLTRAEAENREAELAAREQVRNEHREAALKDAGIVHGSAGGSSSVETPGVTGPSQDDINAYAQAMQREGEAPGSAAAARWRHAVIGRFLPPELFGPQNG